MTESRSTARGFLLILAATILLCITPAPSQARLVEKVVAVVNGEVVTQTEVDLEGKQIFNRIRQQTPAAEREEALAKAGKEIVRNLIDALLVSQKAKELHMEVGEDELDNAVAKISGDNNLTVAELYKELARTGTGKEEYRRKLASQILRSKLLNYEVRSKVVISEEKAREYYDTTYSQQVTEQGYHLLQIGIIWDDSEAEGAITREQARQKAEGLRKLALAGQDFRELARSFSQMPSAKEGGDLGFFTAAEMATSLKEVITALKAGQISEVIENDNSCQFYRLIAKNSNGSQEFAPFEDVREEIMQLLLAEELDTRYKKWLKEIREQAIIEELP